MEVKGISEKIAKTNKRRAKYLKKICIKIN